MLLETDSNSSLEKALHNTMGFCTDMGVEAGLTGVSLSSAVVALPEFARPSAQVHAIEDGEF
eukprot:7515-Amphidinium_carterae.1